MEFSYLWKDFDLISGINNTRGWRPLKTLLFFLSLLSLTMRLESYVRLWDLWVLSLMCSFIYLYFSSCSFSFPFPSLYEPLLSFEITGDVAVSLHGSR
jgi:hypothetical protein